MTKKCIKIMTLNSNLNLLKDLSELSQNYFQMKIVILLLKIIIIK